MLSEVSGRNKENMFRVDLHTKEPQNMVQTTMANLKEQISTLKVDKIGLQKKYLAQIDMLKLQLNEYKKKLAVLTDKYLVQTFARQSQGSPKNTKDYQQLLRESDILFEQEKQNRRKVEEKLRAAVEEGLVLKKNVQELKMEKEKSMEIGLIQKLQLQEKNKLLQEEVSSKKNIILNLKKQLEKNHTHKENLTKQERMISQKSKELQYYSQEISQYNRMNELRMKQQLSQLEKENLFLKEYVKKMEKMAKKQCECESKDEKVRENMFQIKRQLALAKVKLGQNYFSQTKRDRLKDRMAIGDESSQQSSFSFDRRK